MASTNRAPGSRSRGRRRDKVRGAGSGSTSCGALTASMTNSCPSRVACTSRPTAGSSSMTRMRTSPALYMRPPSSGLILPSWASSSSGTPSGFLAFFAIAMRRLLRNRHEAFPDSVPIFGRRERRLDRLHESGRLHRPAQQIESLEQLFFAQAVEGGLCEQEDKARFRIAFQNLPRQVNPGEVRQHQIGHHQRDGRSLGAAGGQRGLGIARHADPAATRFEGVPACCS